MSLITKNKGILITFVLLFLSVALYRLIPSRPLGFAPQIAMALFAGSVIKNRKLALLLPMAAMFISDLGFWFLNKAGYTAITGFYEGQLLNYLLFVAITFIGFKVNSKSVIAIIGGSVAGAVFYYLLSNFGLWIGGGLNINNQPYDKTWQGLTECMIAAIPFFKGSLMATLTFSAIFFGLYNWLPVTQKKYAAAQ